MCYRMAFLFKIYQEREGTPKFTQHFVALEKLRGKFNY